MGKIIEAIDLYREENLNPRTRKEYSQSELGVMMGLSEGIISQWRVGKRKAGIKSLEKICKFLDRDIREFLISDDGQTKEKNSNTTILLPEAIIKYKETIEKFLKILVSKKEKEIHMVVETINYIFDIISKKIGKGKPALEPKKNTHA